MPWADYACPACGLVVEDHVFSAATGAIASAPACPEDGRRMEVIPQANFDARTDGESGKGFQKFDVFEQVPTKDGLVQRRKTVDSLHTLRTIERESEQRFRNGEGEALRFRMASQNRSNKQVGSFGEAGTIGGQAYDSGQKIEKSGKVGVKRHGGKKPDVKLGPGMSRAASALKG